MIKKFVIADSVEHAVNLHRQGYSFLAGGTEINSLDFRKKKESPDKVVFLKNLNLARIEKQNESVIIGTMAAMQDIADNQQLPDALRQAANFIPARSIRNMATLGGNVGARRADSYVIPVLLAMNAELECADGTRQSVREYLEKDSRELILRFIIPPINGVSIAVKEAKSSLAPPVVAAAIRVAAAKKSLSEVVIFAGCLGPKVLRLKQAEQAALKDCSIANVEAAIRASIEPETDILGTADYKKYINAVKIADAVALAAREVLK